MRRYESVPAASVQPGDELAYSDETQFVEMALHRADGTVCIKWASAEPGVVIHKDERVHRVLKPKSEARKS